MPRHYNNTSSSSRYLRNLLLPICHLQLQLPAVLSHRLQTTIDYLEPLILCLLLLLTSHLPTPLLPPLLLLLHHPLLLPPLFSTGLPLPLPPPPPHCIHLAPIIRLPPPLSLPPPKCQKHAGTEISTVRSDELVRSLLQKRLWAVAAAGAAASAILLV